MKRAGDEAPQGDEPPAPPGCGLGPAGNSQARSVPDGITTVPFAVNDVARLLLFTDVTAVVVIADIVVARAAKATLTLPESACTVR